MSTSTLIKATPCQMKQISQLGLGAIEKVIQALILDRNGAQRIIDSGFDFSEAIRKATAEKLIELSADERFTDEEVDSNFAYPEKYECKSIEEQITYVSEIFGLNAKKAHVFARSLPDLPNEAEGWFAIPRFEAVTEEGILDLDYSRYRRAVMLALQRMDECWGVIRCNNVGNALRKILLNLRLHPWTEYAFGVLAEMQPGDILIFPAQLGKRHRGQSVRLARDTFINNEFGLDIFTLVCIYLVHPNRINTLDELATYCTGNNLWDEHCKFDTYRTVLFDPANTVTAFNAVNEVEVDQVSERHGSASGFISWAH